MDFSFDSIAFVPNLNARAVFHSDSSRVFREDENFNPIIVDDHYGDIGGDLV